MQYGTVTIHSTILSVFTSDNQHGTLYSQDGTVYIHHNWFGPQLLLVEGLLSTGPTPSSFYLLVEMGLPLYLFFQHTCGEN